MTHNRKTSKYSGSHSSNNNVHDSNYFCPCTVIVEYTCISNKYTIYIIALSVYKKCIYSTLYKFYKFVFICILHTSHLICIHYTFFSSTLYNYFSFINYV